MASSNPDLEFAVLRVHKKRDIAVKSTDNVAESHTNDGVNCERMMKAILVCWQACKELCF